MPQLHAPRMERPPRIRSMITLQIASEILERSPAGAPAAFATRIQLRQQTQDFDAWFATIVAGDGPEPLADLAAGRAELAILARGDVAAAGSGLSVRVIATIGDAELACRSDAPADVVAAFLAAAGRLLPVNEDRS